MIAPMCFFMYIKFEFIYTVVNTTTLVLSLKPVPIRAFDHHLGLVIVVL
jgi:hypothetical protein